MMFYLFVMPICKFLFKHSYNFRCATYQLWDKDVKPQSEKGK